MDDKGKIFFSHKYIFTVDVEEYYHVENFSQTFEGKDLLGYPVHVEKNTTRLLSILDSYKVSATFFVLGWIAERYPRLIKIIHDAGHEVASHGYQHKMITKMSPEEVRRDIRKSKELLEDITGSRVIGYRAPTFSILEQNSWVYDALLEEGYHYSSSVYPIRHDRYGWPGFGFQPRRMGSGESVKIWEIPMSVASFGPVNIPFGGGGYLRAFPLFITKALFRNLANKSRHGIVYIHPWELDREHPKVQAPLLPRLRHYQGIHKAENKIRELLKSFPFVSIRQFFDINNIHLTSEP